MSYTYQQTPYRERTRVLVAVPLPRAHYQALERDTAYSVKEHVRRAVAAYVEQQQAGAA